METIAYQINGVWTETDLGSLGVGVSLKVELHTHEASKCILNLAALPPEIDPAIPFEAPCIIWTGRNAIGAGGAILFQGRRTDNSGQASGSGASQELVIEDAWYDLRFITLQAVWQNITGFNGLVPVLGPVEAWPDCVLFQASPGGMLLPNGTYQNYAPLPYASHITTGQTIREMLAYAIQFEGVNLQIGQIDPSCLVPFYPVRSLRVSECIQIALRVHPDACCEIDYTTQIPTFNIRSRASWTPLTLPYKRTSGNQTHLSSQPRPRPDLQVPSVRIAIKNTETINGQDVVSWSLDVYPPLTLSGRRSLDVSLDMTGPKLSKTSATLTTAAFDPTNLLWWAQKVPALKSVANGGQIPNPGSAGALALKVAGINGGNPQGIQVVDQNGVAIDLNTYGYELLDGSPATWMKDGNGNPVQVIDANIIAFFLYNKNSSVAGEAFADQIGEHMHTCRIKLVSVPTQTFTSTQTLETGEIYPPGLAQSIYTSLATLQYNFTHTILETPFATVIKPGKHTLNLQGGKVAWQNMNAMIQSVEMELTFSPGNNQTTAKTTVHCGPVPHLDAAELFSIFNLFTRRDLSKINPNERTSGMSDGGGNVTFGTESPKENSVPAPPVMAVSNVAGADNASGHPNFISADAPQGHIAISQPAGAAGKIVHNIKLASQYYDPAHMGALSGGGQIKLADGSQINVGGAVDQAGQPHTLSVWQIVTCEDDGTGAGTTKEYCRLVICSDRFNKPAGW